MFEKLKEFFSNFSFTRIVRRSLFIVVLLWFLTVLVALENVIGILAKITLGL